MAGSLNPSIRLRLLLLAPVFAMGIIPFKPVWRCACGGRPAPMAHSQTGLVSLLRAKT